MVVFKGKIHYGCQDSGNTDFFDYRPSVRGGLRSGCSGWSVDLLNGKTSCGYHIRLPDNEPMSWGYEGRGADLLGVNMLANSLKEDWLDYDNLKYVHIHPKRDLILKRYKQFAQEIVAHLPDEWTMTSDEVLAWLKKKEGNEV